MKNKKITILVMTLLMGFSGPLFAAEQNRLHVIELMNQSKTKEKIQNINALSDADYDSLRKTVLQTLIEDRLTGESDFSYEDIGLGYNVGRKFMLVESKNVFRIMVYDNKVEIDTLYGGATLVAAFDNYVKNFGTQDQLQRLLNQRGAGLNLPYIMAELKSGLPSISVDLDKYEALHSINPLDIMNVMIKDGPRAGQRLTQITFLKKDGTPNRYPKDGININNFGSIRFYPYVELGEVSGEGKTGSCIRICGSANEVACVEKVDRAACESQDVFGGRLRCGVTIKWNQNLNCTIAQKLL